MRVPLCWLAEWIDLPPVAELAERLTMAGLEVDSIERTGPDLSAFRVGFVVECGRHPGADRLSVCSVDVGEAEALSIVCGAPNVAAGQKVAVALPGSQLPTGVKLKRTKIRGVVSEGMICASDELGLGEDHDGILVLDAEAGVGEPLDRVVAAGDAVLEVAILPNRGDCLSMLGMAREVQALVGGELRLPPCEPPEGSHGAGEDVRVAVAAPEACHHYLARVVRGVRVGESPAWLRERLETAGLRPINVVVDVTNLVLLEFGQPLHAFDLTTLRGSRIDVRLAEDDERFTTLDGVERRLSSRDLVIADAERAIALAGVMGGANTEVSEATRDVLLESAHFRPAFIRHTGRRLGLFTDASTRFERGVDAAGVARAADRAARLLAELAGGEVSAGVVEAHGESAEHCSEIQLDPDRLNRLLGTELETKQIRSCLQRVGVETRSSRSTLVCSIPSQRNDLAIPEDLIEEVARIHGYADIPATSLHASLVPGRRPESWVLAERVRDALEAEGMVELLCLPFVDRRDLDRLGLAGDDPRRTGVRVLNPLAEAEAHLRTTLVPSLLRIVRENLSHQADHLALFEVSRVFLPSKAEELPREPQRLGLALVRAEPRGPWAAPNVPLFFDAKGIVERLLARLGHRVEFRGGAPEPYLHPGSAASLHSGSRSLGSLGGLHPDVATAFGIELPCVVAELDLEGIGSLADQPMRYREVSPYPSIRRDLAVLVDRGHAAAELLEAIRRQAGGDLVAVELFDRYEGEGVPAGQVSLAFRLTFQRLDRTLQDVEVGKRVEKVVRMLSKRFEATLR
jgi:phenylalanyl-tRNA synthetase beta chain